MKINWLCKKYADLSLDELYELLALRTNVFVVEQNCPYQELDGKDKTAFHLMGFDENGLLLAYTRILPAGVYYKGPSIGRIVVSHKMRRHGLGNEMMRQALEFAEKEFGKAALRISAQEHLQSYYQNWGFKTVSEPYLEDGIPHLEMVKVWNPK
ncbi:MAG: GNAT family N-acetyltransferase [Flavobacteriales bacterium]|nr:GNAT family N-acetyltransferase [Bacteroidales bacterium AH-315-I05]PCJ82165.1 MAG: GNAT family N-acetyltransferase [Flavobacteriales bacterium]